MVPLKSGKLLFHLYCSHISSHIARWGWKLTRTTGSWRARLLPVLPWPLPLLQVWLQTLAGPHSDPTNWGKNSLSLSIKEKTASRGHPGNWATHWTPELQLAAKHGMDPWGTMHVTGKVAGSIRVGASSVLLHKLMVLTWCRDVPVPSGKMMVASRNHTPISQWLPILSFQRSLWGWITYRNHRFQYSNLKVVASPVRFCFKQTPVNPGSKSHP